MSAECKVDGSCFILAFFLSFKKVSVLSQAHSNLYWLCLLLMFCSAEQQGPQSVAFQQQTLITACSWCRTHHLSSPDTHGSFLRPYVLGGCITPNTTSATKAIHHSPV